jgi:hypothetical protein
MAIAATGAVATNTSNTVMNSTLGTTTPKLLRCNRMLQPPRGSSCLPLIRLFQPVAPEGHILCGWRLNDPIPGPLLKQPDKQKLPWVDLRLRNRSATVLDQFACHEPEIVSGVGVTSINGFRIQFTAWQPLFLATRLGPETITMVTPFSDTERSSVRRLLPLRNEAYMGLWCQRLFALTTLLGYIQTPDSGRY